MPRFKHERHCLFPSYYNNQVGKKGIEKKKKSNVYGPDDQIAEVRAWIATMYIYTCAELHMNFSKPQFLQQCTLETQPPTVGQSTSCLVPHIPFFHSTPSFRFSASESAIAVQSFANPSIQAGAYPTCSASKRNFFLFAFPRLYLAQASKGWDFYLEMKWAFVGWASIGWGAM